MPAMAQCDLEVPVPAVYRGLIIGKGGETLKQLQGNFRVGIYVPKGDHQAAVHVKGPKSRCQECAQEIQAIIGRKARAPAQAKPKAKKAAGRKDLPHPARCPKCLKEINSVRSALEHLQSPMHVNLVADSCLEGVDDSLLTGRLGFAGLQKCLQTPGYRAFHEELGFNSEALLAVLDTLLRLQEELQSISPDRDWLQVESRLVVEWDDKAVAGPSIPITTAPELVDMMERCRLTRKPPLAKIPVLPAPLPRVDARQRKKNHAKGSHQYPAEPGSGRLGLAIMRKLGMDLASYDFVCGTSFIKALAGESNRLKDVYYLQQLRETVFVLHVPRSYHNQADAGHAVERLLCSNGKNTGVGMFVAATTLHVDGRKFMVTSEVDASDEAGDLMEIKSSKHARVVTPQAALQIAVNGSKSILCCSLNDEQTHLEDMWKISAEEVMQDHQQSLANAGQHMRLMLRKVLQHVRAHTDPDGSLVWRLTFDEQKLPVFHVAEDVRVLPLSLD
ncbi:unnamed protein product [Symbiodinium natans]|uniref:K Homology domain-containing protein n=1 Tax=Symbiodinium natans TaxID=878477 RepID=A0A812JN95_9DINO|nr:unnamed protein product [Symbiodinium natans]